MIQSFADVEWDGPRRGGHDADLHDLIIDGDRVFFHERCVCFSCALAQKGDYGSVEICNSQSI